MVPVCVRVCRNEIAEHDVILVVPQNLNYPSRKYFKSGFRQYSVWCYF